MKYKTGDRFRADATIEPMGHRLYTQGNVYAIKIQCNADGEKHYVTRDDTGEFTYLTDKLLDDYFTQIDTYQNYDHAMGIL